MEMGIEVLRHTAIRLFEENIFPHIIGDLKQLDIIQPQTHQNTCAVPTAMLILASLDMIGYLLSSDGKWDKSGLNIKRAITYKNYFPSSYLDKIHKLVVFYRHGLMHSFYPIQTQEEILGIHKSESSTLFENNTYEGQDFLSLNVNVFSDDFKTFIDKLFQEIKTTEDLTILENISHGFKSICTVSMTTTLQTTIPVGVIKDKSKRKQKD
jgi:hypothetical protein